MTQHTQRGAKPDHWTDPLESNFCQLPSGSEAFTVKPATAMARKKSSTSLPYVQEEKKEFRFSPLAR
jgi:hypothetical protein